MPAAGLAAEVAAYVATFADERSEELVVRNGDAATFTQWLRLVK